MNLNFINDLDLENPAAVAEFIDLNALAHEQVFEALLRQGIVTEHYPLWTSGEMDQDWMTNNAKELTEWGAALNIPVPMDVSTVDLENEGQMRDWLNSNASFLSQVSQTLGI